MVGLQLERPILVTIHTPHHVGEDEDMVNQFKLIQEDAMLSIDANTSLEHIQEENTIVTYM